MSHNIIKPFLYSTQLRRHTGLWVLVLMGLFLALWGNGPTASAETVADTKFSVDRGFYSEPFQVEITTATPGTEIRYTINGSKPGINVGWRYTGPITIDKTTILRAIAFSVVPMSTILPSNIDTQTYIFPGDVIHQQASGQAPAGWPSSMINDQVFDYGMDPDVTTDARYADKIEDALLAIPSISIVTDLKNLFDPTTGIYVNAYQDGIDWERPSSLELINPDGSKGFQVDCGLRMRGGFSRAGINPKHSFRLFFRGEYGDTKLRYPMFGDEGVKTFDNLDLRTAQNNSWAYTGSAGSTFNIDVFSRDTQRAMGEPYTRSRYYHVYLNGQYWGLYQSQERAEAGFAASYLGGEKEDYDVIKPDPSIGYKIIATDGVTFDYGRLWQAAVKGFTADADYYKIQGLNPDGTNNPDYDCLVDIDNLIDYMLVIYYTCCWDGPIVMWEPYHRVNNFFSSYNRVNPEGFRFFCHDAENSLNNIDGNNLGPHITGEQWTSFNPLWLHQQLMANKEYKFRFADHVRRFCFDGGVLTPSAAQSRFQSRADEIDQAIIAESARWGDAQSSNAPFTRDDHWLPAVQNKINGFLSQRTAILVSQFKANGWYPSIDAPSLNQYGGAVDPGFILGMSSATGSIYYTTDGSDPRLPGGTLNPAAKKFAGTASYTGISNGGVWKYFDQGTDLGTAWREPAFDDSAWPSGSAQLGYGDEDENTIIGFGPDAGNKYLSAYFRRNFTISNPAAVMALSVSLMRDDGAVVYINGQEVVRSNMPDGEIAFNTPSAGTVGGTDESTFYDFVVSPGVLVAGDNSIAVEVHQASVSSTDLSFDLKLQYSSLLGGDPITLDSSTVLKARTLVIQGLSTLNWSALTEARFFVNTAASAANLAISEINYNPPGPTAEELAVNPLFDEDDFEFIELLNISGDEIDLGQVALVDGIIFDFALAGVPTLAPGERIVIVHNQAAFEARYGTGIQIAGEFEGNISNKGERLLVTGSGGQVIFDFEYGDSGDWPSRADGSGASLELEDPSAPAAADYDKAGRWRSSSEYLGSPGRDGLGPLNQVVINEVLTHTDPPQTDSIELLNITDSTIDLSGWTLSDTDDNLFKFVIPNGTELAPGGYIVFDENDFNPSLGLDPNDFGLNGAHGDDVWLMAVESDGDAWFADHVDFDAAANGESFGRWPTAADRLYPMSELTLGDANSGPRVGPLVISEIHYHPATAEEDATENELLDFIEIANPTAATVDLSGWRIDGLDFLFPSGSLVRRRATLVVVAFDPDDPLNADALEDFRQAYGIDRTVQLAGPYLGQLSNSGERLKLMRPDAPPTEEPDFTPFLIEDEVGYNDKSPWPEEADGSGMSLNRLGVDLFGDDPATWVAALPTPGSASILPQSGVEDSDKYQ